MYCYLIRLLRDKDLDDETRKLLISAYLQALDQRSTNNVLIEYRGEKVIVSILINGTIQIRKRNTVTLDIPFFCQTTPPEDIIANMIQLANEIKSKKTRTILLKRILSYWILRFPNANLLQEYRNYQSNSKSLVVSQQLFHSIQEGVFQCNRKSCQGFPIQQVCNSCDAAFYCSGTCHLNDFPFHRFACIRINLE